MKNQARTRLQLVALCVILGLTACQQRNSDTDPFGLRVVQLKIDNSSLFAEVADTPRTSANGLMFRDSLREDHGMLFIFDKPRTASFWMKNTTIPLSIAYIDSAGKIREIRSMKPLDETLIVSASPDILFALEVNEGWFKRHGISAGDIIRGIPKN